MSAKEFLENIRKLQRAIDCKLEKIDTLRELATGTSVNLSGMPHNPSSQTSPMANAVCKIVDLEHEVAAMQQERQAAIDYLCTMEDSRLCTVLIKRYVQEKEWEDIAAEMHCSRTQVFRFHRGAIIQFEKLLQNGT